MADATAVIRSLGEQIAQLTVDKTIALAELAEARERIAALEEAPEDKPSQREGPR
jgi:hypothetical protein